MTPKPLLSLAVVGLSFSVLAADDQVTISKSRLQELERKEAELQKLKAAPATAPVATQTPGQVVPIASKPVYVVPPISSLPPVAAGELVSAMDLASYFAADPAAAERRYRKATIKVRGEVSRIDKHMFQRTYDVTMKTPDHGPEVVCEITPDDGYDAIYSANHGTELIGKKGPSTQQLMRLGQTVVVEGRCKGLKGRLVVVSGRLQ